MVLECLLDYGCIGRGNEMVDTFCLAVFSSTTYLYSWLAASCFVWWKTPVLGCWERSERILAAEKPLKRRLQPPSSLLSADY